MGCCLSNHKTSQRDPCHTISPKSNHKNFESRNSLAELDLTNVGKTQSGASLLPYGPVVEEEFVKEVLSETPIAKPQPCKPILDKGNYLTLEPEVKVLSETSHILEAHENSESFSMSTTTTTTTTITEVREGDEAISKRKKVVGFGAKGSPANAHRKDSELISGRKDRPVSPASRAAPFSEKKNRMEWRSIRKKHCGQMGKMQHQVGSTGDPRYTREVYSRRPRTLATRMAGEASRGGIETSSSKETIRSGNRSMDVGVAGEARKEEKNDNVLQMENESLENPVVSLECFIFL